MLYYVDRNFEKIIDEFVPQIPKYPMQGENTNTERICLCKNVKGCLNAASWGNEGIADRGDFEIYRLYCFDEKDIQEGNLIDTDTLWKEELVPDAYLTDEVWVVNQNLKPVEMKYIRLGNFYLDTHPILGYSEFEKYKDADYWDVPAEKLRLIQEINVYDVSEDDLFYTNKLENDYMLDIITILNFVPEEAFWYFDEEENCFQFHEGVYISKRYLEEFLEEQEVA